MILNGKHLIGPEESVNFGHSKKHFFLTFFPFLFQNLIFAVEMFVEMVIFKAKTGKWNEMRIHKVSPSYDPSCAILSFFNFMVIFNIASVDIAESQLGRTLGAHKPLCDAS